MPLGQTIEIPGVGTRFECSHCGLQHRSISRAEECCNYACEECGERHRYPEDAENCCLILCRECGASYTSQEEADECCAHVHAERERREQARIYPLEVEQIRPRYWIAIPEIPGRPGRLCSVEQELSDGGQRAARLLYRLGMSERETVTNYSADCMPGQAIVKQDGSLNREFGGEVVYSRFNLANRMFSERFSKAIWILRELRNQGLVTTSRNAGVHIHISATSVRGDPREVFGPAQMANLYEIFSFCEDVLFRLAAAGWASHRGLDYTQVIPKDGSDMSAGKLAKYAMRERHYSLNFQRLLNAARDCGCGACQVGDWAECECGQLQRGTVEWRIFNATTKPETMHGWLLLAHAITAKAFDYRLGDLQPNTFGSTEPERQAWILGWILNECPLTLGEKGVILSLAKRSPGFEHINWAELEENIVIPPETDDEWDDDQHPAGQAPLIDQPPPGLEPERQMFELRFEQTVPADTIRQWIIQDNQFDGLVEDDLL